MAMADKYKEAYDLMGRTWRLFGDSPEYSNMREAMTDMCGKLTEMCTPNEQGQRPVFTEEDNAELRQLQDRVVDSCLEYLQGKKLEDIHSRSGYIRHIVAQRIVKMVDNDRKKMEDIDFDAHMTLREIISRARGTVEEIDLESAAKESGSMNTRIYLPATAERKEGYFTLAYSSVSEEALYRRAVETTLAAYSKYAPFIRFLTRPQKNTPYGIIQKNVGETLHGADRAEMEMSMDEDGEAFRTYVEPYLDALKKVMGTPRARELAGLPADRGLEEMLERQDFRAMLFTLHDAADHAGNKFHVLCDTGILVGRDISRRNVAMSVVAEQLGRGSLIAKSSTMIVIDKASRMEYSGVFMEKAKGLDLNRQNQEPLFFEPGIIWDTPEAKLQLASMQVIDWICGNTDRHYANMFYDLQRGEDGVVRLLGVQGIDNDNSFGVKSVKELKGSYGSQAAGLILPTPDTMGIIRRDDAMLILKLGKRDLNLMLFNLLEPDEIEATWKRVNDLQKAIMKGEGVQWKSETETKWGIVRVLSDEEVSQMPRSMYSFLPEMRRLVKIPEAIKGRKERKTVPVAFLRQ